MGKHSNRVPVILTRWIPREGERIKRQQKVTWADQIKKFAAAKVAAPGTGEC